MAFFSIAKAKETIRNLFRIKNTKKRIKTGSRQALQETGKRMKQYARKEILDKSKKTGRVYIRRNRFGQLVRHQASAPGEFPANMTGGLVRSINYRIEGNNRLVFGSDATTLRSPYPRYLEEGTKNMKPRPWLSPTVKKYQKTLKQRVQDRVNKEVKR